MPGKVDDFGSPYHNSSTDSENLIFCVGWSQDRNAIVTRAFLGVGAPEAVLVGVVALVLFGPKGLAQAAKSLGQGVKAIAPTLK